MRMDRRAGLLHIGGGIDVTAIPISFTGSMTDEIVTMNDGNDYRLLTLTSNGNLTIKKSIMADIWLCGGGADGNSRDIFYGGSGSGGGGGYAAEALNQIIQSLSVVIGAANTTGVTSVSGDISLSAAGTNSQDGGSGGGGGYAGKATSSSKAGTGDGIENKRPFSDEYFSLHCSGGGGGGYISGATRRNGGSGGELGSNGLAVTAGGREGGTGGEGAGDGGAGLSDGGEDGADATEYGCGGGGGGGSVQGAGAGGAGMQGVCYIRIPLIQ